MKVKILASGSKGNSTLIISNNIMFLIDLGITYPTLKTSLTKLEINPNDIPIVLITHTHNDHIKGLASFIKKTGAKCYVPLGMVDEINQFIEKDDIVIIEDEFSIMDFQIQLIHTSHDTACSVGYIIITGTHSLVYVTDTGYINQRYLKKMKNKEIYILESNHDEKMLMNGPYPYYLKQRVISDKGHLSNRTTALYLKQIIGKDTKYIVLAHLSEKNNTEELAKQTILEEIKNVGNSEKQLLIARQKEESPYLEV